eukprot:8633782-Prorocentrum_lima.AAC.1
MALNYYNQTCDYKTMMNWKRSTWMMWPTCKHTLKDKQARKFCCEQNLNPCKKGSHLWHSK